jgi:nicotinamide-nucleotide amidase
LHASSGLGALLPSPLHLWNGLSPDARQYRQMVANTSYEHASAFLDATKAKGLMVATAESCTGGLIAASLAAVPGASDVLERGFVTYSNKAKEQLLGVAPALLNQHGAVSKPVALAMVAGALAHSPADIAVAVTGVAGPGGGSAEKPVGLVHIAAARRDGQTLHEEKRFGDIGRHEIQVQTVAAALDLMRRLI